MIRLFIEFRMIWLILGPLFVLFFNLLNYYFNAYSADEFINLGFLGLFKLSNWVSVLISSLLIIFNATLLSSVFNKNDFHDKTIYSTGFTYIVMMSLFHSFYNLNNLLLIQTLLILVFRQLLLLKQQESEDQKYVFNGSFFLGIGICIHSSLILYLIVFLFSIWNIKSFSFRDLIIMLTGIIVPFIFVGGFYFLNNKTISLDFFSALSTWKLIVFDMLFVLIILSFITVIAFASFRSNAIKSTLRLRKMMFPVWGFLFLGLLFGIYDFVFYYQIDRFILMLVTLPILVNYSYINRTFNLFSGILFFIALGYSFFKFFTVLA
jgi:hypothetical protein